MKEKFYRFMQGRYGIDQLNSFLMIVCVICFIVNMFIGSIVLNFFSPLSRWLKLKLMSKQDPSNKYFSCPKCKQMVRVPKGHGTVVVTCPNCQNKFEKRT